MIGKREEVKEKSKKQKVISEDQAELDFNRFVDSLGLKPRVLESMEEEKDAFVKGVEWGNILVDEDGHVKLKLDDPVEFNGIVDTVSFKHRRLTTGDIEKKSVGKSDLEKSMRLFAVITGNNSALFRNLNGGDLEMIATIGTFFLK